MIVCICREISDNDYLTEDALKSRIMQSDFKCGLCQTRYIVEDESKDTNKEIIRCNN